jgi:hypothetical protein
MKIQLNPIDTFYWDEVVPNIGDLLKSKPLELTSSRGVSDWKSIDFINYWQKRFHAEFGFQPQVANRYRTANIFKMKVIDYFYDRVNEEIRTFIDWVISTKQVKQARIEFIHYLINEYMEEKIGNKFKISSDEVQSSGDISRVSERATLEFYGTGFNDSDLSKEEYFVGLKWREENLSEENIKDIEKWHTRKFKHQPEILDKLRRWKEEYEKIKSEFNLMRQFYLLEAKKSGKSVAEVLRFYHAPQNKKLFNEEEFNARYQ